MAKSIYLLAIITMFAAHRVKAQDTTLRSAQLQQVLGMTKEQYKNYSDSLKLYDKRITSVLKNSALDRNTKGIELSKALKAREGYMQRRLTADQRKKLSEFNSRYALASPRIKNEKQHIEELRKRGVKMVSDSIKRQSSINH